MTECTCSYIQNRITYKKDDGIERGIMGEPPLKLKKTENEK